MHGEQCALANEGEMSGRRVIAAVLQIEDGKLRALGGVRGDREEQVPPAWQELRTRVIGFALARVDRRERLPPRIIGDDLGFRFRPGGSPGPCVVIENETRGLESL